MVISEASTLVPRSGSTAAGGAGPRRIDGNAVNVGARRRQIGGNDEAAAALLGPRIGLLLRDDCPETAVDPAAVGRATGAAERARIVSCF